MRVYAVGLRSGLDAAANTALAVHAVTVAADDAADLVVLPEYAARFDPRGVGPEHAEPLDRGFVPALQDVARTRGVAVIAGTTLPGTSRAVNAVVAIDAAGTLVGVYRKVHLYDAFGHRESDRLEPGPADAAPLLLPVGGFVVGVLTCYDLRFPESARRLVDAGADVLAVPAAWAAGEHKADHWRTLLRARAIENTAYVLGAAQQGPGVTGESMVVDPDGVVLASAPGSADSGTPGAEQGAGLVAAADLLRAVLVAARERNPSLANRRYAVVPRDGE
jgi:predicted amidohydrolase